LKESGGLRFISLWFVSIGYRDKLS